MGFRRLVSQSFRASGLVGVIGAALVLSAVAAAWCGTSAQGSTGHHFTLRAIPVSAVHHSWQVPRIRNANGSSSNWSGYAAYPSAQTQSPSGGGKGKGNGKGNGGGGGKNSSSTATFSDVTGSWVVPSVAASSSDSTYSSSWVGLDGYNDGTVEQVGTEQDWSGGSAQVLRMVRDVPEIRLQDRKFPCEGGR